MSLYTPYFECEPFEDGFRVRHNCDGSLGFSSTVMVNEETFRLIKFATVEGERQRSRAINKLLGDA